MLPLLSSLVNGFFPPSRWALYHLAPIGLVASWGVWATRRQRPALRAGANTRHPILSASCDESRQSCGRRPHLSDGFFTGPEVHRVASTSTRTEVRHCVGRCLLPLCALPPRVTRPCPKIATGPSATCALPPPSQYAATASHRYHNGP
jgi:hypothetical protein